MKPGFCPQEDAEDVGIAFARFPRSSAVHYEVCMDPRRLVWDPMRSTIEAILTSASTGRGAPMPPLIKRAQAAAVGKRAGSS